MTADNATTFKAQPVPPTIHPVQLDQIVLFGDSITQDKFYPLINGWGASLSHTYQRRLDVINRGYSGYTTEWNKHILPSILRTTLPPQLPDSPHVPKLRLVTICLGANDAVNEGMRQYCPIDQFKQNLKDMIQMVHDTHPDAKVLLISTPPLGLKLWGEFLAERQLPMDRVITRTQAYHFASLEVAAETSTPVVDTWKAFFGPKGEWDERADSAEWFYDGLHPGVEGGKILAKAVLEGIISNFPELEPESMPMVLPPWDGFDIADLQGELFKGVAARK
ncbi:hypothetical protein HDV00_007457 [Rhizophlyctis rosea]|nr:hypothetical protein HDV00_007457 [Rhizophlyctis rosea]